MYDILNMKATYKFADTIFEIESCFDYFHKFAKEYVSNQSPKEVIKTNIDQIKSWKQSHDDCEGFDLDYIETLVIHSLVADKLASENKFIIHGSAIYLDNLNNGYIFVAPSGVGKSTHVRLLRKVYKDRVNYINDDKPFLLSSNDGFYIYGSPWNGKEHNSNNIKAKLNAIFVVSRSKVNKVSVLEPKVAINYLIKQLHIPEGMKETMNASNCLIKLCESLKVYLLEVNMEDDASKVSYDIMFKGVN